MKIRLTCSGLVLAALSAAAQPNPVPKKIVVPAVSSDKNQVFNILHFEPGSKKDSYSILYYQPLRASVIAPGETVRDTGNIVFSDAKKMNPVNYSDQALLVIKQTVNADGSSVIDNVNVLAKRKFESTGPYTLYFPKGFKHPVVNSAIPISQTVYNLDNVPGLSQAEYEALSTMIQREYAPDYYTESSRRVEPTLAESLIQLRNEIKYLGATGLNFKGDIPATEKVLSRFTLSDKRNLVVTNDKAASELKFYLTEDFTKMEQIGSAPYQGEITVAALSPIYNDNLIISGAYGVAQMKIKGPDKKDVLSLISFAVNENNDLLSWNHSVGVSKLSSVSPELAWFDGDKIMLLSTNAEKTFKQFHQVHEFEKGKEPLMTFPLSEEDKKLDKFAYTKTFQPDPPGGIPVTSPPPTARIPYLVKTIGNTTYWVIQSYYRDAMANEESYLGLDVYKFSKDGKFHGITALNGYKQADPTITEELVDNNAQLDLLIGYPSKFQLELTEEQPMVVQVESAAFKLIPLQNGTFRSSKDGQTLLLGKNPMGTSYTILAY